MTKHKKMVIDIASLRIMRNLYFLIILLCILTTETSQLFDTFPEFATSQKYLRSFAPEHWDR